jgi:predicted GNAT family acetyltransferase
LESLLFRLPENIRVGPLSKEHLDIVCENWRHYDPEYRPVVGKMIELNPSFGVFLKNEDGTEELASMVLQSEYGGVGLLQTVPKFRRKGYADIAQAYQTRALGQMGVIPHGHILLWNEGSNLLFKKHGYKVYGVSTWVILTKLE